MLLIKRSIEMTIELNEQKVLSIKGIKMQIKHSLT